MPDKIVQATQAAIQKLEAKIADLEEQLKAARADLQQKQAVLKLAGNGAPKGGE